jgi:hypothetical protein
MENIKENSNLENQPILARISYWEAVMFAVLKLVIDSCQTLEEFENASDYLRGFTCIKLDFKC